MKTTNEKLEDYLLQTARTYNTGFFPSDIYMEINFSEQTDVEIMQFFIKAAKNFDNKTFFEGDFGPYVESKDALVFLQRFDKIVYENNSKEEAKKLIDEYYALAN